MTSNFDFDKAFQALTEFQPFPWQRRLFDDYLSKGEVPAGIDIPTGLGKTAVMAIWLLARAKQRLSEHMPSDSTVQTVDCSLPRRLVYIVDRRAVVDQATDFAEKIRKQLHSCPELKPVRQGLGLEDKQLPISTLRGQHADNREWMEDPSAEAIIVGTVDMIGSRLLFEGYGVSRKMRPFAAGLLGCDTLIMLDEAHLVPPFEKLLRCIENGLNDATFGPQASVDRDIIPPMKLLPLSATFQEYGASGTAEVFGLVQGENNEEVNRRLSAPKHLKIIETDELVPELVERAWTLASKWGPKRVLVYCNSREDALKVQADIDRRLKSEKSGGCSELLVGARRVYEREKLAKWLKEKGFIGNINRSPEYPLFLIATSAGEVGVDLDADDMVCDLVEWERMAQRLGRVNRRGNGNARIEVVVSPPRAKAEKSGWEERLTRLRAPLDALRPIDSEGSRDASPNAILDLKLRAMSDQKLSDIINKAKTPAPLRPAITRPLVDAWSLTSLVDHAGRPEVAPWLRGWVDESPQTIVIWRNYLPLRFDDGKCQEPSSKEINEFFEAMPLHAVELLETETFHVCDWLRKRMRQIDKDISAQISNVSEESDEETLNRENTIIQVHSFPRLISEGLPIAFVLDNDNTYIKCLKAKEIKSMSSRELMRTLTNRKLVVDVRTKGLRNGLLDATYADVIETLEQDSDDPKMYSLARRVRLMKPSEREDERLNSRSWREVLAFSYRLNSEGETEYWLVVQKSLSSQSNEEGRSITRIAQRLTEHQEWAGHEAGRIADALGLSVEYREMLVDAARYHDDGKASPRWQRAFNAPSQGRPYAKTTGPFNKHVLNGYRHELQSVIDAEAKLLERFGKDNSRHDLILHLIAAHHGYARPSINIDGLDSLPPTAAERYAYDIAIRFAKLQRQLGPWGLAWWEALLRSADQSASRKLDEIKLRDTESKIGLSDQMK